MTIGLSHYLTVAAVLFTIGVLGVMIHRHPVIIFMCIELMLNAANLAFVGFNRLWPGTDGVAALDGQVFVLIVITVAAAEVAVGLSILLAMFRNRDSVDVEEVSLLKW